MHVHVDAFVGWPAAPHSTIDRAKSVCLLPVRVGQPLGVFVGVLVPYLAAQLAEVGRAGVAAQEADQFTHRGLERELLGGDGRKTLLQVEAHHRAWHAQGPHASAVVLPAAVVEDVLDKFEVLLHGAIRFRLAVVATAAWLESLRGGGLVQTSMLCAPLETSPLPNVLDCPSDSAV